MTSATRAAHTADRGRMSPALGLLALTGLAAAAALAGLCFGDAPTSPAEVARLLFQPDDSYAQVVVSTVRLPRVVAAALAGSSLAVAGAIMQGVTQNPLASPGLLGINSGAALGVTIAAAFYGVGSNTAFAGAAALGAGLAAVAVYALASAGRGGASPLKLTLAGAIFGASLTSLTTAILIVDAQTFDQIRLWTAGSVANRPLTLSFAVAPWILGGLAASIALARPINALGLGKDAAAGLGQNAALSRAAAAVTVAALAGGAVALAGPIGFVGLVTPHVARTLVGADNRWIMPYCAVGGALLLLLADLASRLVAPSSELPVGVTMALIGCPFFIHLARTRIRR